MNTTLDLLKPTWQNTIVANSHDTGRSTLASTSYLYYALDNAIYGVGTVKLAPSGGVPYSYPRIESHRTGHIVNLQGEITLP